MTMVLHVLARSFGYLKLVRDSILAIPVDARERRSKGLQQRWTDKKAVQGVEARDAEKMGMMSHSLPTARAAPQKTGPLDMLALGHPKAPWSSLATSTSGPVLNFLPFDSYVDQVETRLKHS